MKTILLVDDEERIRRILGEILKQRGFNVMKANNAMEAHRLLKESGQVDLVLLDINLPEVGGDTLYDVMQSFHYKSRVIVCSVLPVEEQSKRILNAVDYYDKSESFAILLEKIDRVFGEGTALKKILIIDDDPQVRHLYRKLLKGAGYFPIDSGDHPETIRFLKRQLEEIDLILLDIAMPRVSGLELYELIKKENPHAKVIISSVFSEEQQKFFIFNADGYFDKSRSHRDLLDKIKSLIGHKED